MILVIRRMASINGSLAGPLSLEKNRRIDVRIYRFPTLDCGKRASGYALPYFCNQPGPQSARFGIENECRVASKDMSEALAGLVFQLPGSQAQYPR